VVNVSGKKIGLFWTSYETITYTAGLGVTQHKLTTNHYVSCTNCPACCHGGKALEKWPLRIWAAFVPPGILRTVRLGLLNTSLQANMWTVPARCATACFTAQHRYLLTVFHYLLTGVLWSSRHTTWHVLVLAS
jgi:hypothetical protein